MSSTPLKYQIQYIKQQQQTQPKTIKISFQNPFFTKSVNLPSLPQFPKTRLTQYQYHRHPKSIQFILLNPTIPSTNLSQFSNQLTTILSQILIKRIKNKYINKSINYSTLFQSINLSLCCGFHIINKTIQNYSLGQFILFYFKSQQKSIHNLISYLQAFQSNIINYPLTQSIYKYKIPQNFVRNIFQQMIHAYAHQIISLATSHYLHVFNMGICKRAPQNGQKQWFLSLYIEGMISNVHIFYQALQQTINSIPLYLIKLSTISSVKMNKIHLKLPYTDKIRMLNANYLLIMNRKLSKTQINDLSLGYFFINENQFNQNQLNLLKIQTTTQRFKKYIEQNQLSIQQIIIFQQFILLKTHQHLYNPTLTKLKAYLSSFQLSKTKCHQFKSDLLTNIFYQYYRHKIQKKLYIQFFLTNNQLWRQNYTIDQQQINILLQIIKQQITKQFTTIPSLIPISPYLSKLHDFQHLYTIQKNPPNFWQKNTKSTLYKFPNKKTSLILTQFTNLTQFQSDIIFIIHQQQLINHSQLYIVAESNLIDIAAFVDGTSGQKPCRVKKYRTKDSLQFRYITLLYFDPQKINIKYLQQDICNCIKSLQNEKRLNIYLSLHLKKFIQQHFIKLLIKINQITSTPQSKLQTITLYYQHLKLFSPLERTILNSNIPLTLITHDLLDPWSLLKLNNLKQYILSYYQNHNTYQLPGLDSYISHHRKSKTPLVRSLLTIPPSNFPQLNYHQFFINFCLKKIYQIPNYYNITEHSYTNVSKQLQKFISYFQKQFPHIQFFLLYAKNINKQIAKDICMNIYYTNEQKKLLMPLNINFINNTITTNHDITPLPFTINKKTYIDWFKIITHKKCLNLLEKCLEK